MENVINETHILDIVSTSIAKKRLSRIQRINYEKGWDIISICHDNDEVVSFKDCETQLLIRDELFLKNLCISTVKTEEAKPVDTDKLLGINKKVGIKCPECHEQETTYKLFANRSADEGMTAYCSCRSCTFQWTIKM